MKDTFKEGNGGWVYKNINDSELNRCPMNDMDLQEKRLVRWAEAGTRRLCDQQGI